MSEAVRRRASKDWAVIILAAAFGIALIVVTVAVLWTAINNGKPGLAVTEQDVQLLTGWGGGVIGVLGAYVGFRAGDRQDHEGEPHD